MGLLRMEFTLDLQTGLLLAGTIVLLIALSPVKRIVDDLPPGRLRQGWKLLGIFIVFFLCGYLGCLFQAPGVSAELSALIVPLIFFFGALFVLMVAQLSLQTNRMIRRVATLERENITDSLTGLHNRRHLDAELAQEIQRARRYDSPLSVLLLDLDHFKKINDTYGHQQGDRALQNLGSRLRCLIRDTDIAARYGGEEFAVIAPHTPLAAAAILGERIRRDLEGRSLLPRGPAGAGEAITISIGAACLAGNEDTACTLIARADDALYRAKKMGRNRVELQLESPGSATVAPTQDYGSCRPERARA